MHLVPCWQFVFSVSCWSLISLLPHSQHTAREMTFFFKIGDPKDVTTGSGENSAAGQAMTTIDQQRQLVGSESRSDAVFMVGPVDGVKVDIPVHSFLLRKASQMFDSMFSGTSRQEDVIPITDCSASVMFSVIRWVYCCELVIEDGKFQELQVAASKFMIDSLLAFIAADHSNAITTNPWSVLTFAIAADNIELKDKCTALITSDMQDHLSVEKDFMIASAAAIHAVLVKDFTFNESRLLRRCLQWAEHQCEQLGRQLTPSNKRQLMEPFIREIAFSSMTVREFKVVSASGILTEYEELLVFRSIAGIQIETGFRSIRKRHPCRHWQPNCFPDLYSCTGCGKILCWACFSYFTDKKTRHQCTGGRKSISRWYRLPGRYYQYGLPDKECCGVM